MTTAVALLDRVREVTPLLREEAAANEALGRLTERTGEALRSAGLLQFCAPRSLGGAGVSPAEALRVLEALSGADGSAGWVAMVTNSLLMMLTYLAPSEAERFCAQGLPVIAGHGAPLGLATPVSGSYRVRGRWSYASGFHLADVVLASCLIADDDGVPVPSTSGLPEMAIFLVPASAAQPDGNWDVIGLRGTGSVDYVISDSLVPAAVRVDVLGPPRSGLGFPAWASLGHTSAALGIARHALDEAASLAGAARGPLGVRATDSELVQLGYAKAEATLRSARAFAYETWADISRSADPLTTRQQTLLRLGLLNATSAAEQVATFAYRLGGGVALRDSPLQRCVRDVHAATQHVLVGDPFYRDCGRELLGAAAGRTWTLTGLA